MNTTFIEVNVGENSLQVTCEVKGSPKPMKRWEKDGQTILTCNDDSYYCHLYFAYIAYPQHDGEYTCIAENIVDKASKSVTIQVLGETLILNKNIRYRSDFFYFLFMFTYFNFLYLNCSI